MTCRDCKFSTTIASPSGVIGEHVRVCRRNPPQTLAIAMRAGAMQITSWVVVQPTDWCGEFARPEQVST